MSWAEVKKINSNLDTPLDELLAKMVVNVQRGVTSGPGNITISAVDMNKTVVFSKSKGSAGYVAARGNIEGNVTGTYWSSNQGASPKNDNRRDSSLSATISGGTTDLTVKEYSARLISATTLACDGPVEWQVVEYF